MWDGNWEPSNGGEILTHFYIVCSITSICCCSGPQSRLTLCDPMDCRTPGFPVLHGLLELAHTPVPWVSESTMPSKPLIPCDPVLLLPSVFPSISESESHSVVSDSLQPHWLFVELSRPEYWSGKPSPSPGDLPTPGIERRSPKLQVDSLSSEPPRKPS